MGTTSGAPFDAAPQDGSVVRVLGAFAAALAWLGWLTICPALGFPTLATAAMLNRVLVPGEDPGFWLGWALLLIGLASAVLLYWVAADRGRIRPSIASGLVYGAIGWLLAGAVVMPILGLISPAPTTTTPAALTPPDPMQGSFMMLQLGVAAPIAALVAWLVFGAVLGATASSRHGDQSAPALDASASGGSGATRARLVLVLGPVVAIVTLAVIAFAVTRLSATPSRPSATGTQTIATQPLQTLPKGPDFVSILELSQGRGATLGAHVHPYSGIAYSLKGVATIAFVAGQTIQVPPGEAGFIGAGQPHSHLNADDRLASAAIALLIVVLAVLVCLIGFRRGGRGGLILPAGLVLLITVGALGTLDPWANDWLFISVRSATGRGSPMPLPTASRKYESPDIGSLAAGPYMETLDLVTVAPGTGATEIGSAGATTLFVLDGRIAVQPPGGSPTQIGPSGSTLVQPGASVQVVNAGDGAAHFLRFAVTATPAGS